MRASGGADAWHARILTARSGPSHEQIATRAYELHERGSPGDAEAHWLAASRS